MFVIPELHLKDFIETRIPSARELYYRYGGSIAQAGRASALDFSQPVNSADNLDKVSLLSKGVEIIRESEERPAD